MYALTTFVFYCTLPVANAWSTDCRWHIICFPGRPLARHFFTAEACLPLTHAPWPRCTAQAAAVVSGHLLPADADCAAATHRARLLDKITAKVRQQVRGLLSRSLFRFCLSLLSPTGGLQLHALPCQPAGE